MSENISHVDLVLCEWGSGRGRRIGRFTAEITDKDYEHMADALGLITEGINNDYLFVTARHQDHDCPFSADVLAEQFETLATVFGRLRDPALEAVLRSHNQVTYWDATDEEREAANERVRIARKRWGMYGGPSDAKNPRHTE